jgi:iron complex outermembrane recepter protein
MKKIYVTMTMVLFVVQCTLAQNSLQGKVYDSQTKEPLVGATVVTGGTGTTTSVTGTFVLYTKESISKIEISYIGYDKKIVAVDDRNEVIIGLTPAANNLQPIVVTANREAALRTEVPVAISKLSSTLIQDTKPVLITELINKVPGVVMLNYNNEQHAMAIRQPMGTSAYFLYMEDGLPIRPMGVFNHNALIEMNVFSISTIEVIKGPASSIYGPEAVGGAINFITQRPTIIPSLRLGLQGDQWGYKRLQYGGGGMITKRLGIYVSGFVARQRDSWQSYSDYDKSSVNIRFDYSLSDKTRFTLAYSGNEYYSDAAGSVDSTAYYSRAYVSATDFTYRKVHSQRTRFTTEHRWNENNETAVTLFYRHNYIEQNPAYGIRWKSGETSATGEVNRNTFSSKGVLAQHSKRFSFLNARVLGGATVDYSPTDYWAYKINLDAQLREDGKNVEYYTLKEKLPADFLSQYDADLTNAGLYAQVEINPIERLKVTVGARYDRMSFSYENYLDNSSGKKSYQQLTPKVGATFDLGKDAGLYANYSEGFSPPSLTSVFRKRPSNDPYAPADFYYNLDPATFNNAEVGGWTSLFKNKIYADVALYQMNGYKELLNIRQTDNSYDYQSAGKTLHRGIEYGITYKPNTQLTIRFGGTNAIHQFVNFTLSNKETDVVKNVNGNDMPQSPRWIANGEITYKPTCVKGFRIALEWQRISSWYQNQVNTVSYNDTGFMGLKGISYLNLRAGYTWKGVEVFANIMNLTDELYSNSATRGNGVTDRTTFTPAAPRTVVVGVQYELNRLKN